MNRNLILGALAAGIVAIGAYVMLAPQSPQNTPISAAQAQSDDAVDTSIVQDLFLGEADAPITVIEYASFTCPHCRTFHENAFKQLKADYIDTGKVKFVLREVYFDRYGLWAGMVARCNEGQRYFGIVDLIFAQQSEWTQGDAATIAGNLRKMGLLAGMDAETVDACMQDATKARALQAFYEENARADNIRATPSFVINGTTHSNMSYAELKSLLDAQL